MVPPPPQAFDAGPESHRLGPPETDINARLVRRLLLPRGCARDAKRSVHRNPMREPSIAGGKPAEFVSDSDHRSQIERPTEYAAIEDITRHASVSQEGRFH